MKKTIMFAAAAASCAVFAEATIDNVSLEQLWPFSTDIKVTYTLSGATSPVAVNVSFANGETPIAADLRIGENARGDLLWVTNGACSFTFDPKSAFAASGLKAIDNLKVTLTSAAASGDAEKMSEALYKIVNLDTGDITDVTRADLVNGLYGSYETNYDAFNQGATVNLDDIFFWTGVTNGTLYKTQLMALRRISAATYGDWTMGNSSDCANSTAHTVSLTKDYWLGVFEVTQDQYRRITGSWGYSYTTNDARYGDHRLIPAITRWNDVRDQWGTSATAATKSWPAKTDHTLMDNLFLQKLRTRTRNAMKFDLPTEAQWEFACRAGTDTALFLGAGSNDNLKLVGWGQVSSGMGANGCPTSVGRFYPNAFGLYDMLGNLPEVCLDFYVVNYAVAGVNPVGPDYSVSNPAGNRVQRGRGYNNWGLYCAWRENHSPSSAAIGVRVCCTIEE